MNEWGLAGKLSGLSSLTDTQLESGLRELLGASARIEVRIALQLLEVEQRRLHLRTGYSSLYEYCRERMGLSEFEAYLRICAARVGRAFPLAFELLSARAIHLSTIHLLRDYLTTENHRELLAEASHKSKRQVAELLARRFPRADVATTLQKLPSLEPLSPSRYRLELTIGAELKRKLELASDLLSHANPSRDLGTVIERALDELISRLEKRRFAETKAPKNTAVRADLRAPGDASGQGDATAAGAASGSADASAFRDALAPAHDATRTQVDVASPRSRRHIANAVRRDVSARDERRCTFTSQDGRRCQGRAFLQLHHERAFARGGAESRENLRWLCAAHNGLLAERDFGVVHVRQVIAQNPKKGGRG
jgi:hypothetical protein